MEVHVGYLHDGPNLDRLLNTQVRLHALPAAGNHDPRLLLLIRKLIRDVQPDVVQTWLLQMDVFGGMAALTSGRPWILSERAAPEQYETGWKNRLRLMIGARSRGIVANSFGGLKYWERVSSEGKLRRVIRNIVPLKAIAAAAPADIPPDDPLHGVSRLIMAAGRFEAEKNWPRILEALDLVLSEHGDAHALLFGDGVQREEVLRVVSQSAHRARIHVRGYTSQLWRWLKRATVYVSASRYEGSPNVVLEALACGCPLVVSDIPGHRELLEKTSARLVPPGSAAAMAEAIGAALRVGRPTGDAEREALATLAQWSPASIAAEYRQVYEHVARNEG